MNYVLTPYKRTIDLIFENKIKFINKDSEKGVCFKIYPIQSSTLILPYLNLFVSNSNEEKMPKLIIGSTYDNLSSMIVLFKNDSMWGNIALNEGFVSLKEKDRLVMLAKNHHYVDFKLQQGLIKIILEEKCRSKLILEKYLELISRLPRTLDYKYYCKKNH